MKRLTEKSQKLLVGFVVCFTTAVIAVAVLGILLKSTGKTVINSATQILPCILDAQQAEMTQRIVQAQNRLDVVFAYWMIVLGIIATTDAILVAVMIADGRQRKKAAPVGEKPQAMAKPRTLTLLLVIFAVIAVILIIGAYVQAEINASLYGSLGTNPNMSKEYMSQYIKPDMFAQYRAYLRQNKILLVAVQVDTLWVARHMIYAFILCLPTAYLIAYIQKRRTKN